MKNFDEAVNNLINMFKNEDFPQKLALTIIKRVDEGIPSDKWSITNKLIMLLLVIPPMPEDISNGRKLADISKKAKKPSISLHQTPKKSKTKKMRMNISLPDSDLFRYSDMKALKARKSRTMIINPRSFLHF